MFCFLISSIHYFETLFLKAELIIHYDYFNTHSCEKLPKPTFFARQMNALYDWMGSHSSQRKAKCLPRTQMFYFFPLKRTRPRRMLNNFHLYSCLPRLIVKLSPSTVEPTPSSYSALCSVTSSCCDLIWKRLYADAYIVPPARISTNKQTQRENHNLDWRANKRLI